MKKIRANNRNRNRVISMPANDVRNTSRLYSYPVEMIDSPDYWDSEYSFFGATEPAPATGAAPAGEQPSLFATVGSQVLNLYQQYLMMQDNRKRAAAGLPPLSAEQYAAANIPPARAQIGIDPATRNLLIALGLGITAILVVPRLIPKRGR